MRKKVPIPESIVTLIQVARESPEVMKGLWALEVVPQNLRLYKLLKVARAMGKDPEQHNLAEGLRWLATEKNFKAFLAASK